MTARTRTAKKTVSAAKAATVSAAKTIEKTMDQATASAADSFAAAGFEVPEAVRAYSEQAAANAKEAYARIKANAEEATDALEDTFESARDGISELQHNGLDVAKDATDATFAHAKKMIAADSLTDALELQTSFAKERYEALVTYAKSVQESSATVFENAAKPARNAFTKTTSV